MNSLKLYIIFHLNLMYSAIPIDRRMTVIQKCYWPILDIVETEGISIGIELSGITLEEIKRLDPNWIIFFKKLINTNKCELIGSGYSQLIGPLVPSMVNKYNQELGIETYDKILGHRPEIALVNEQAYSSGLIWHYKEAGYKSIIMEWDNPYRFNRRWNKNLRYYSQIICDNFGNTIPVIWSNAIAFQKFQRYAQGEIELDEYINYLNLNLGKKERFLSLYSNDAEVFDFRPGRFITERKIHKNGEWNRIKGLIGSIKQHDNFEFIPPSFVLSYLKSNTEKKLLKLESSQQPLPVKKQEKYNITRWAVTGKNDSFINAKCYEIFNLLASIEMKPRNLIRMKALWRELCYLWSSDFRTHIDQKRWLKYIKRLKAYLKSIRFFVKNKNLNNHKVLSNKLGYRWQIKKSGSAIKIFTDKIAMVINPKKGLSIESLIFKDISSKPLIGTISHGYYDDIGYGADFFTAHTIIEQWGKKKITDLEKTESVYSKGDENGREYFSISCSIHTMLGDIKKDVRVYFSEPYVSYTYLFDINLEQPASIRTGIITFFPFSFNKKSLYYKTVNGGILPETFLIRKYQIKHIDMVDKLISANHCLGATEGWIEIGDDEKNVTIYSDKAQMYSVPMIDYQKVGESYFLRCLHSVKETDETSVASLLKGKMQLFLFARKNK